MVIIPMAISANGYFVNGILILVYLFSGNGYFMIIIPIVAISAIMVIMANNHTVFTSPSFIVLNYFQLRYVQ
jgi:hypothetical protein